MNIHLRILPKSRKQYHVSNVNKKIEIEMKRESKLPLEFVGLSWRWFGLEM
jgi:hypothetical protein